VRVGIGVGGSLLIAFSAAYWVATGGIDPARKAPAWLTEKPIAHRGLYTTNSVRPENSLAAFRAAADRGFAIELDVQVTSDGQLVVLHDRKLERMTGDPREVSKVPAAEVTALRFLGSTETVPTLAQVFDVVGGRVPIFIEVKNRGEEVGRLEDEVASQAASAAATTHVAIVSFNPRSLARIAEKAPSVPRGQSSGNFQGDGLSFVTRAILGRLLMNWKSRPDFISYELDGLPSFGTWLQKCRGRPLIVWTARTQDQYERARKLGDNVMFELDATPGR